MSDKGYQNLPLKDYVVHHLIILTDKAFLARKFSFLYLCAVNPK